MLQRMSNAIHVEISSEIHRVDDKNDDIQKGKWGLLAAFLFSIACELLSESTGVEVFILGIYGRPWITQL